MRVPETPPNALGRGSRFATTHDFASGAFLPPSPPAEKATARQDQAGQIQHQLQGQAHWLPGYCCPLNTLLAM